MLQAGNWVHQRLLWLQEAQRRPGERADPYEDILGNPRDLRRWHAAIRFVGAVMAQRRKEGASPAKPQPRGFRELLENSL